MTFNPDLPVQTRDGRKARIICTDMGGKYPIVAVLELGDNDKPWPSVHQADGREWTTTIGCDGNLDLINIPEKPKTYWVNIYPKTLSGPEQFLIYGAGKYTKSEADDIARLDRIACLEFTEGQGL